MIGLDMIHGQTLSGQQIDNMSDHQLKAMVNNVSVFYRVTPRHKLTIIKVMSYYQFIFYLQLLLLMLKMISIDHFSIRHYKQMVTSLV